MKERVRAVLVTPANTLLVIKRTRPGVEPYWVIVGGGVEPTDTSREAALLREVREEVGGKAEIIGLLHEVENRQGERELFYLARIQQWDFTARSGPEFALPGRGVYELDEIPLTPAGLAAINLMPPCFAAVLGQAVSNGGLLDWAAGVAAVTARPATADDVPELIRLWLLLAANPTTERQEVTQEFLSREVGASVAMFVVDAPDRLGLAACAAAMVLPPTPRLRAHVQMVITDPDYRRRGYATACLRAVIDHARAAGCTRVELNSSEVGAHLYRSLGFEQEPIWRLKTDGFQ